MDVTENLIRFERKMTVNERLKADLAEKERVIAENLSSRDDAIRAAIQNEKLTRQRVQAVEKALGVFVTMSFRHRLEWVFLGRIMGKAVDMTKPEVKPEIKEEPVNAS